MTSAAELVVTHSSPADTPSVEQLFIAYRHFYGRTGDDAKAAEFLRTRLSTGESRVLAARTAEKVVGFCQIYKQFSSLGLTVTWVLNDLFVLPEARGLGAGRALVVQTLREARAAGAVAVVLETMSDNEVAQTLYRSLGFVESHRDGEFVHYRNDLEGGDHV
ncbi:N-acetyltransferase [Actinoplanes italicus]|uniref:Acetyltransferase (GNAT) family protein n=1 Tax=Actinoplanes italicus TaxID=113567 RepID=A0A2T0KHG1_9ACTN|nr:GNAT family N-acetyltransferase [Actinoplanes italicus]PRX22858.1 acetyltransferase (GNAT) family protein [Actinoplanes italicus]GIE28379.1 N-acetyltransferase [Actinoplanes italicus]